MKSELKESLGYIFFKNPVLVLGLIIGVINAIVSGKAGKNK